MQLFTVYEIDLDDEGCARLHVNTDNTLHSRSRRPVGRARRPTGRLGGLDDLVREEAKDE